MAQKDVRFVIRAKDEATKTFESIVDALKDVRSENLSAGKSADVAGSLMGEFAKEVAALSKELGAVKGAERLTRDLERAGKAVQRIEEETRNSATEFARLARETDRASQSANRYRHEVDGLRDTLSREREALKGLNAERTKANRELQKAETAYRRVEAASKKADPLSGRGRTIASAMTFAQGDVDKSRAEVERLNTALEEQKRTIASTTSTLKERGTALREVEREERRLRTETERVAKSTAANKKALDQSRASLSQMGETARKTGSALGNLAMTQEKIAAREKEIAAARTQTLAEQEALARYANQKGGFTDPKTTEQINKQVALVKRLENDYKLLAGTAQRLSNNLSMIGPPTANASAQMRQAAGAAAAAKREYEAQLRVLNQMPGAMNRMNGLRGIFGGIYGESRKAMSVMQRLRGEVLSLATAYVGLYGTITNIGGVIGAYQQLEAAQNRLGAVFDQNEAAVTNELKFVEAQAARLGIQFGVLADQYGKFSVAARAANFSVEETRKVFLSVAEAGRVNKLSMEQMQGIFLALEQMISKGKVQSEELRRQLGDRLPGAFNIMADALGVTTAQLDDMMQKGQILADSETMTKFADELTKRFGGQLAKALTSTTTLLGKFSNELFQAQLRVAQSGFIEGFNKALEEMIGYFQSREGRDFFLSLGSALGNLVSALAKVPQYFGLIGMAIKTFIAYKVTTVVVGLSRAFMTQLVPSLVASATNFKLALAGARAYTLGLTTLGGAAMSAGLALRSIPGVALFAAAMYAIQTLMFNWVGGVDDATRAADEHERIMMRVREAYSSVADAAEDWGKKIKDVTVDQADANLRRMMARVQEMRGKLTEGISEGLTPTDFDLDPVLRQVIELIWQTRDGKRSFADYREELEKLYRNMKTDKGKEYVQMLLEIARKGEASEREMREAAQAAIALETSMEDANRIAEAFGDTMGSLESPLDKAGMAMETAAASTEKYKTALAELHGMIPELVAEAKKLEEIAKIEENFETAMSNLGHSRSAPGRLRRATEARDRAMMNALTKDLSKDIKDAVALIAKHEGFRKEAYPDYTYRDGKRVNSGYRVGYGSDTYDRGDGRGPQRVTPSTTVTQEDAIRDLGRRIGEFQATVKREIGLSRWGEFTEKQQAVLTSLAYNYGNLSRTGILATIKDGDVEEIAKAIEGLGSHNQGINRSRRQDEASIFRGSEGAADVQIRMEEKRLKDQERITDELNKQTQAVQDFIASKEFELTQNQMIEQGLGRQAAIEAAINDARRMKKDLSEAEIQAIGEIAGKLWDQKNATDGIKQAEEEITRLQSLRSEIMQQIEFHQGQGEMAQAEALKARLAEINDELRDAIANTIAMYQAMGGPQSELAIARLQNVANGIQDIGQKAVITGEMIADRLTGALTNAFKSMAQAIANGEDAWEAFSTAFLQGIAEMLIEIGELIIRYTILNALKGFMGGMGIPMGPIFHSGGIVGGGRTTQRPISPAWFGNAVRYHKGGIAGLRPGEVPAILEQGEEVLTRDDPRHVMNGGAAQAPVNLKVVNAFDAAEVVSEGLSSPAGEQTFLNMVRRNTKKINQALGG